MSHLTSCLDPKIVRNRYTHELICVPCGKCAACRTRKSSLWVARLREETACHAFTLFGTLTYDDAHLPRLSAEFREDKDYTPEYLKAYANSLDFIDFHNGMIPCVSSKDIQDFFKRLRSSLTYYLRKNYGKFQRANIRYFVVSEYGPTTFRPHYHMLLWFDDKRLYPVIKEHIFKAWQCKTCYSSLSAFLQRNKWKFVVGHCESYCAGYLAADAHLPEILRQKPFRTFHLQSSLPPIGTIRILQNSISALLTGNVSKVHLGRLSSLQSVVVPLWSGIENRFFPKCLSFANLSPDDRRALYGISNLCYKEGFAEGFEPFKEWILSQWFSDVPTIKLLRFVCTSTPKDGELFVRRIRYLYGLSARVSRLSQIAGVTLSDYVSGIESYYSRKNYDALKLQLSFEELMSNSNRSDYTLRHYPFLVDALFYENYRNLPFSTYSSYLEQFGLGQVNDFMFMRDGSLDFKEVKGLSEKIVFDNTKIRVKKDYVNNHPECVYNYKDLLRSYSLIH